MLTKLFLILLVALVSDNVQATDTVSTFGAGSNILGMIDFFWPASDQKNDANNTEQKDAEVAVDNTETKSNKEASTTNWYATLFW